MNNDILPEHTNFIIVKAIDNHSTTQMAWPISFSSGKKVEVGLYGFTVRPEKEDGVRRRGYLVRLEDGTACFIPRESFEVVEDDITFLRTEDKLIENKVVIVNLKTDTILRNDYSEELIFYDNESAENYITQHFENYKT